MLQTNAIGTVHGVKPTKNPDYVSFSLRVGKDKFLRIVSHVAHQSSLAEKAKVFVSCQTTLEVEDGKEKFSFFLKSVSTIYAPKAEGNASYQSSAPAPKASYAPASQARKASHAPAPQAHNASYAPAPQVPAPQAPASQAYVQEDVFVSDEEMDEQAF